MTTRNRECGTSDGVPCPVPFPPQGAKIEGTLTDVSLLQYERTRPFLLAWQENRFEAFMGLLGFKFPGMDTSGKGGYYFPLINICGEIVPRDELTEVCIAFLKAFPMHNDFNRHFEAIFELHPRLAPELWQWISDHFHELLEKLEHVAKHNDLVIIWEKIRLSLIENVAALPAPSPHRAFFRKLWDENDKSKRIHCGRFLFRAAFYTESGYSDDAFCALLKQIKIGRRRIRSENISYMKMKSSWIDNWSPRGEETTNTRLRRLRTRRDWKRYRRGYYDSMRKIKVTPAMLHDEEVKRIADRSLFLLMEYLGDWKIKDGIHPSGNTAADNAVFEERRALLVQEARAIMDRYAARCPFPLR